jgi:transposase
LKRKYESLIARKGKKKSLVAIGRCILVAAYHVLERLEEYKEPTLYDSPKKKANKVKNHLRRLQELGYEVTIVPKIE